jgi:3-oxoacyl-[acyl-carrier protein] reductase
VRLKGKIAVVTGGARGQGKSHCLALAKEGAKVVVVDICRQLIESEYRLADKAVLDSTVDEIKELGHEAIGICCDITVEDEVKDMFKKVQEQFGGVDILINNAGMTTISMCEEMTEEEWDLVLDVNLKGVFLCCKHAIPYMKSAGGKIVNISSIAACQPNPGGAHYGAAKTGVVNLTMSYAVEFAPYGINVNAIGPGLIHTEFQKEIARVLELEADETISKKVEIYNQFKRPIPPESVSAAVVFLVSDDAKDITGQTLYVDQGWTLARPKKS